MARQIKESPADCAQNITEENGIVLLEGLSFGNIQLLVLKVEKQETAFRFASSELSGPIVKTLVHTEDFLSATRSSLLLTQGHQKTSCWEVMTA